MYKISHGLNKLPHDPKDFKLGSIFDMPKVENLPESFFIGEPTILDQIADQNPDYCTGYAISGGSKFQDGEDFYPPFSFAASKKIAGDVASFGVDIRSSMKGSTTYGELPLKAVPPGIKNLTQEERRYFDIYSDTPRLEAQVYLKKTYFAVTGPYDVYDNIRSAIWLHRADKQAVYIGVIWSWPLGQYLLDGTNDNGGGHCMYIYGWDKDGLAVANSAGKSAGVNGTHRIARETINHFSDMFGCFMLVDIPLEVAKKRIADIQIQEIDLLTKVLNIIKNFLGIK